MLQNTIIFVSILQDVSHSAKICFFFEKYKSLRSEICTEISFKTIVEEGKFSPCFPDMSPSTS